MSKQQIHIIPAFDLIEHSQSINCVCCPEVQELENTTLIIHNAYDKRELVENLVTSELIKN